MIDFITLTGGLPRDAETRTTPNGATVTNFTLAQSDSKWNKDNRSWDTIRALYIDVVIWNENPEWKDNPIPWADMASTLQKGDQVAVHGKLRTRSFETKEGQKRTVIELEADRFYVTPQIPQQHQGNTWGQPAPTGQASADEEPPF